MHILVFKKRSLFIVVLCIILVVVLLLFFTRPALDSSANYFSRKFTETRCVSATGK